MVWQSGIIKVHSSHAESALDYLLSQGEEKPKCLHGCTSLFFTVFNENVDIIASCAMAPCVGKLQPCRPRVLVMDRDRLLASLMLNHSVQQKTNSLCIRYANSVTSDLKSFEDVSEAIKCGSKFFILCHRKVHSGIHVVIMLGFKDIVVAAAKESTRFASEICHTACTSMAPTVMEISQVLSIYSAGYSISSEHQNISDSSCTSIDKEELLLDSLRSDQELEMNDSDRRANSPLNWMTLRFKDPILEDQFEYAHAEALTSMDSWRYVLTHIMLVGVLFFKDFHIVKQWSSTGYTNIWLCLLYMAPSSLLWLSPEFYIRQRKWICFYILVANVTWHVHVNNYVGFLTPSFYRTKSTFFDGFTYVGVHAVMWLNKWELILFMVPLSFLFNLWRTGPQIRNYAFSDYSMLEYNMKVLTWVSPVLIISMVFCYLYELQSRKAFLIRQTRQHLLSRGQIGQNIM